MSDTKMVLVVVLVWPVKERKSVLSEAQVWILHSYNINNIPESKLGEKKRKRTWCTQVNDLKAFELPCWNVLYK